MAFERLNLEKMCTKVKVLKSKKIIKKWGESDMAWVPHGFTTLFKVITQTLGNKKHGHDLVEEESDVRMELTLACEDGE